MATALPEDLRDKDVEVYADGQYLLSDEGGKLIENIWKTLNVTCDVRQGSKPVLRDTYNATVPRSKCWTLPNGHTVVLSMDKKEECGAEIVLDAFETKTVVGLNTEKTSRFNLIQFPIPCYLKGDPVASSGRLHDNMNKLFKEMKKMNKFSVALDVHGIPNWPMTEYLKTILKDFLQFADTRVSKQITFILCSSDTVKFVECCEICKTVLKASPSTKEGEATSAEPPHINQTSFEIEVVEDSLDRFSLADVLVCTVNEDMDLKKGAVSAALLKRAGGQLQIDLDNDYPDRLDQAQIADTCGNGLKCHRVFYSVLYPFRSRDCEEFGYTDANDFYRTNIHELVNRCLKKAEKFGYKSIAFPVIGSGNLAYPLDIVADEMFEIASQFHKDRPHSSIQNVYFVIYPRDIEAIQVFKEREKEYVGQSVRLSSKQTRTPVTLTLTGKQSDIDEAKRRINDTLKDRSATVKNVPAKNKQSLNSKTPTSKQQASEPVAYEKHIKLPDETTVKLLQYFHHELLNTYQNNNCKVTFKNTNLIVYGPNKAIERMESDIESKLQHLRSIQSMSIDVSLVDKDIIRREKENFNDSRVLCLLYESKQEMQFYAYDQNDLNTATHRMKIALGLLKPTARSQRKFKSSEFERSLSLPSPKKATSYLTHQPFSWSRDAKYIEFFKTKEDVVVKVYVADILRAPVDCIVNAANRTLEHGGGVAKAISKAAGRDLDKESAMHVKRYGKLSVGTACRTTPGKLPFQCVVHAVGPCWEHYKPYTLTKINTCETDLFNAVLSALHEASKYRPHLKSIAFPAISSAIYGCPDDLCCVQYAKAVLEFSKATGSKQGLEEIHFVDVNVGIVKLIQDTFATMIPKGIIPKSYDKMQYVKRYGATSASHNHKTGMRVSCISPKRDSDSDEGGFKQRSATSETNKSAYPYLSEDKSDSVTCKVSEKITLIVKLGDLMGLTNKDMIACSSKPNGGGDGIIAKAIESKGGKVYKDSKKKQFNMEKANYGDVIVCDGGSSPFKHVAHVILFQKADTKDDLDRETKAKRVFIKLFKSTHKHKCRSLVLSLIGTGKGKAHPKLFASLLFASLNEFAGYSSGNLSVYLMNNDKNKNADTIEVIKNAISKQSGKTTTWHVPASSASNSTNVKVPTGKRSSSFRQSQPQGKGRGNDRLARSSYPSKRAPTDFVPSKETSTKGSDVSIKLAEQDVKDRGIAFDDEYDVDRGVLSNQTVTDETDRDTKYTDSGSDGSFEHISADEIEQCVICMDSVTNPQTLDCNHVFCKECIQQQFKHKKVCPTCGAICGIIKGDQPKGTMDLTKTKYPSLAGFEKDGRIDITYTFPSGHQGRNHPSPGRKYRGFTRTAYLPDNSQGRQICAMLEVAFDRKLIFTIGSSRTTGQEGVITWNDIHHKTDPKPNTSFGYPDPTYFDRVTDELKAKGVTINDIPTLSSGRR